MPDLYIIDFTGFELRDPGNSNAIVNNETDGGGNLIGWNTDDPAGNQQSGGADADQWVINGYTLTFTNSGQFYDITDDDVDFDDDDVSGGTAQTITNAITFGTETYPAGSLIEAEFHIVVRDPNTSEEWTLAAVNIGGSGGDGYSVIQGFAVVDRGDNSLPPLNVALEIVSATDLEPQDGGSGVDYEDYAPCFTKGTLIETAKGPVLIEDLEEGDLVYTLDAGLQPIRWIGHRTIKGRNNLYPIRFEPGAIGNKDVFEVSPQHRILFQNWKTELSFGEGGVLIKARDLINDDRIYEHRVDEVTYYHILFDQHQIVFSNGVQSESFLPGPYIVAAFDETVQEELFEIFPELRVDYDSYGPAARMSLKAHEVATILLVA